MTMLRLSFRLCHRSRSRMPKRERFYSLEGEGWHIMEKESIFLQLIQKNR